MGKPTKSEGGIYFRKDRKKWEVRFLEYDPITSKNKTRTKLFKTQGEAKKYLDSVMYQKENPLYIEHHGIPFCELMKTNQRLKLDTNQITEVTYLRNLQTIEQIEKYPIGKQMIDEIRTEEIQAFINSYKHLSNSTISKLFQQLGSTFKLAMDKGYITRNPMIPLPEFLKDTIIEQMQMSEEFKNNDENLLFKPEDKQYVDRVNVNTELKRLLKRHFGIDDITTHSLRHTYGTRCIEAGVAPVVVQKMMGHTDVSITLNTYTSVFDKFKEKEIEKVNKYYMEENMLNAVKLLQYNENNDFDELENTKEL